MEIKEEIITFDELYEKIKLNIRDTEELLSA